MKKSKNTKRALLASMLSTILCLAMLIGSTFAWFTDTASTKVNKIQSGTLDVALVDEKGNSLEGKTLEWIKAEGAEGEEVLWEPGCTYKLQPVYVKNNGNLALKFKIVISGIVGDAKLLEAIDFTYGELDVNAEGQLEAGATSKAITIEGHMKETAGNEYQNLSIDGIGITVVATQDTVESDSYNNQYDKDAEYPVVADVDYDASTKEDFLEALDSAKEGETTAIHLKQDITLSEVGNPDDYWKYHYKINGDKDTIIDLGGRELTFVKGDASSWDFTGGILASGNSISILNGVVNVEEGTGIYTTGKATSHFKNVTFNVKKGYGVQGVGFTEFKNCEFNVAASSSYGIFCARATTITNCIFKVDGFNCTGIQMNNQCNDNVITNSKFEVIQGTAIYINGNSDAQISNVDITLAKNRNSVTGIYVSSDSSVEIGENVVIMSENTGYSSYFVSGSKDLSNITLTSGLSSETDGTVYSTTAGASPRTSIKVGTYWKTVPAN